MPYNPPVLSKERLFVVVCVRSIAQPGRALRSGRRGRRFESCYSDHKLKPRRPLGVVFNLSWSVLQDENRGSTR